MKTIGVCLIVVSVLAGATQGQNPFKSLGIPDSEVPVLTLSKGKYPEFIPNDTLVQIGSVMFNTRTGQVTDFVVIDSTRLEATLEADVTSRFLAPDPLAAEYPISAHMCTS